MDDDKLDEKLLVKNIYGEVLPHRIKYRNTSISVMSAKITCILENDLTFELYNVHPDVVFALRKYEAGEIYDDRETIIDVLIEIPNVRRALNRYLKRIVIDEYDESKGAYSASVEFGNDSFVIKKKMVPSHAILLARILDKPIYVKKDLVEHQLRFHRSED